MMKKILLILLGGGNLVTAQVNDITSPTVLTTTTTTASSGRVGINTNTPTQTLDVVGNGRFRNMEEGHNFTNFPRFVVSKEDGTLGYTTRPTKTPIVLVDHIATGLKWNTRDNFPFGQKPDNGDPLNVDNSGNRTAANLGVQDNTRTYIIFGQNSNNGATSGGWVNRNTTFSAVAGDVLSINANISVRVMENYVTEKPLVSISPNGDRQIIITMLLYRGTTLVSETKQVINFNGRNDATKNERYPYTYTSNYDSTFSQNINLTHSISSGETADNYNVSVTLTAKAPRDGQFRIDLQGPANQQLKQKLIVTRL